MLATTGVVISAPTTVEIMEVVHTQVRAVRIIGIQTVMVSAHFKGGVT